MIEEPFYKAIHLNSFRATSFCYELDLEINVLPLTHKKPLYIESGQRFIYSYIKTPDQTERGTVIQLLKGKVSTFVDLLIALQT